MDTYQKIISSCLLILTTIALAGVFTLTKVILIPFTLAVFISLVYSPIILFFQGKFKVPKALILFVSFIVFVGLFLGVTTFIAGSIDSFVQGADQYKDKLHMMAANTEKMATQFGFSLPSGGIQKLVQKFPVINLIKGLTGSMLSIVSNTFLVIVFTLFLLTGESMSKHNIKILEEIKISAAKYVGTKLLTSGATGILTYIVLAIFKVEMAFMFATLTFLLNFIPNIGSIIAVALPLPVILLQFGIGFEFVFILVLLVGFQTVIGNVLEPKLLGESMGLHPVTILLFLTFWGYIWGITGMFLSVPITATLKIIFSKFEMTKPISDLFSGKIREA